MRRMLGLATRPPSSSRPRARRAATARNTPRNPATRPSTSHSSISHGVGAEPAVEPAAERAGRSTTERPELEPDRARRQRVVRALAPCGRRGRCTAPAHVASMRGLSCIESCDISPLWADAACISGRPRTTRDFACVNRREAGLARQRSPGRCPRRCARGDTNIASNCEGGRNTPRSRMLRKNVAEPRGVGGLRGRVVGDRARREEQRHHRADPVHARAGRRRRWAAAARPSPSRLPSCSSRS